MPPTLAAMALAWVLWQQILTMQCEPPLVFRGQVNQGCLGTSPMTPNQNWQYVETFDTREACGSAQTEAEARHPKPSFPVTGNLVVQEHTFRCLPLGLHPKDTE